MAANYQKRDGFTFTDKTSMHPFDETTLLMLFDQQVDHDIEESFKKEQEEKFLRKLCWVKLGCFIPQYVFSFLFIGKKYAYDTWYGTTLYYKFLRKKITFDQFKTAIYTGLKESRLV